MRPEDSLYPLADGMTPETALFTDPAIFAPGAVHDARIKVGIVLRYLGWGHLAY